MADILQDYVLFNGALKKVGGIDTFKPPTLERTLEDFRAAGMDAAIGIDMGMAPLVATWTSSGIDRDMYQNFGLTVGAPVTVNVRAAVKDHVTGLPKLVWHTMGGDFSIVDPGEYVAGQRATLSVTMRLKYYRLAHTIPGTPLIEIDLLTGRRVIGGVDQLAAIRALTGR